ncbi:surface protease GP63, putative, partial [Trypanosoma cruzi]
MNNACDGDGRFLDDGLTVFPFDGVDAHAVCMAASVVSCYSTVCSASRRITDPKPSCFFPLFFPLLLSSHSQAALLLLLLTRNQEMQFTQATRQPRHATPLLPLVVVLLMYCASGCVAAADPATQYRCGFDAMMRRSGPLPTAVAREVPRRGQGAVQAYTVAAEDANNGWESLRIMVSVKDLEDETKHCTKVGETKPDFTGRDRECAADDILTAEKKRTLLDEIIPVAVNLHAERLLVQRINVPWVMPGFGERSRCQYFTVPPSHRGVGVLGADMVLYV